MMEDRAVPDYKVYILCFPRTASRYFNAILESKLGYGNVHKTHNIDIASHGKDIIGLIRKPIDQFTSAMTQGFEFGETTMAEGQSQRDRIIEQVPRQIRRYCETMDRIMSRCSIIFDYDFFTTSPDKAADIVLEMLGEEDLGLEPRIPGTQVDGIMRYMKSSKESEHYNFVRSVIETQDISAAEAKYQEVLAKAYRPADV